MKYMKVIVPLLVVVALLLAVMPAGAQGPVMTATGEGVKAIFVRTAGTNEDPFGGFPRGLGNALTSAGVVGRYGLSPFAGALPGGVPSTQSGDGSSTRKALYLGGAWADTTRAQAPRDPQIEIPVAATVKIAAGTSRWFKMDTWKNKKLQIWLDDELNTATSPSGAATWGAANKYFDGTAAGDAWGGADMNPNFVNGYYMQIYDPDTLSPNYAFTPPNAWILTVGNTGSGSLRRAGQNVPGGSDNGRGITISYTACHYPGSLGTPLWNYLAVDGRWWLIENGQATKIVETFACALPHGYGNFNKFQPSHLLWYEGNFDGWVYVRVYNQMIWDGVVSVGSYRATK